MPEWKETARRVIINIKDKKEAESLLLTSRI
jgi:hypothetical protein